MSYGRRLPNARVRMGGSESPAQGRRRRQGAVGRQGHSKLAGFRTEKCGTSRLSFGLISSLQLFSRMLNRQAHHQEAQGRSSYHDGLERHLGQTGAVFGKVVDNREVEISEPGEAYR
jgi:hypothetical protein